MQTRDTYSIESDLFRIIWPPQQGFFGVSQPNQDYPGENHKVLMHEVQQAVIKIGLR